MSEETTTPTSTQSSWATADQSAIFGVSVRAWLAIILVITVCAMSLIQIDVKEPLYTLVGAALGFYFGGRTKESK